ncbi:MAG: hypothetical protein K8W52_22800 [Deltaproteobacteria bacterium]|nr:hypothetical protein [Deltaproteobacteria bacterium]
MSHSLAALTHRLAHLLPAAVVAAALTGCLADTDSELALGDLDEPIAVSAVVATLPNGIVSVRTTGDGTLGAVTGYDAQDLMVTRGGQTAATKVKRSVNLVGSGTRLDVVHSRMLEPTKIALAGAVSGRLFRIERVGTGTPVVTVRPTYGAAERALIATWAALDPTLVFIAGTQPCLAQGLRTVALGQACLAGTASACPTAFDAASAAAAACPL